MDIEFLKEPKNIAALGILGAIGFSLLWTTAVVVDGGWVFGEMTLSELGDPTRPADAIFNASCILAGIVLGVFAFGMRGLQTEKLPKLSMNVMLLASVFLVGVGLFPIHVDFWHTFFSWAFFLTMMASIVISIPGDWIREDRGRTMAVVSTVLVLVALVLLGFTALALAEAVAVIFIMIWAVMRSLDLIL